MTRTIQMTRHYLDINILHVTVALCWTSTLQNEFHNVSRKIFCSNNDTNNSNDNIYGAVIVALAVAMSYDDSTINIVVAIIISAKLTKWMAEIMRSFDVCVLVGVCVCVCAVAGHGS